MLIFLSTNEAAKINMNMISQLRQRVSKNGTTTISVEEFNQLQSEWIKRVGEQAPIDNGIEELDALCEKYNSGEIGLCKLICDCWNKAIALKNKPDK